MTVDVIDRHTGSLQRAALAEAGETGYAEIRLELTPGASAIQVTVRDDGTIAESIEVSARPGELVRIEFRSEPGGKVRATAPNRKFFVLPDEEPSATPLLRPPDTTELDVVVLVDGTCTHPLLIDDKKKILEYLLAPSLTQEWQQIVSGLTDFVAKIAAKYPKLWMTALAFGEEDMSMLKNKLLHPDYLIYPPEPENRKLRAASPDHLTSQLRRLPPTPGADYVDALADGLRASADAEWRQNSRKLLVLFGQSPGYSVLDESDESTNLLPRRKCIEDEIATIHGQGIEVVTVFHHSPAANELYGVNRPAVINHSRRQYKKLASLPEWSASSPDTDFGKLANDWLNGPRVIAKGPSPGMVAEV